MPAAPKAGEKVAFRFGRIQLPEAALLCLKLDAGRRVSFVGLVAGRTDEVLLAVSRSPFPLLGPGTALLSKSSRLRWQLILLHGAILFLPPSSATAIVSLVPGLL